MNGVRFFLKQELFPPSETKVTRMGSQILIIGNPLGRYGLPIRVISDPVEGDYYNKSNIVELFHATANL